MPLKKANKLMLANSSCFKEDLRTSLREAKWDGLLPRFNPDSQVQAVKMIWKEF